MHYPIAKISFEDSIYENRINVSNIDFEVTPSSYGNQPLKPTAIHISYTFFNCHTEKIYSGSWIYKPKLDTSPRRRNAMNPRAFAIRQLLCAECGDLQYIRVTKRLFHEIIYWLLSPHNTQMLCYYIIYYHKSTFVLNRDEKKCLAVQSEWISITLKCTWHS